MAALAIPLFEGTGALGLAGAGAAGLGAAAMAHHAPIDFSFHGWPDASHSSSVTHDVRDPYPIPPPPPVKWPIPQPPKWPVSFEAAGTSKAFGANATIHTPVKIAGSDAVVSGSALIAGPYGAPHVVGGGMQVSIPFN